MDIVSYVQGLARPLVIIRYLYVSTASLSRGGGGGGVEGLVGLPALYTRPIVLPLIAGL